jgi:hypothetical protein
MNSNGYIILYVIINLVLLAILISWFINYKKKKERNRLIKEFDEFVLNNKIKIDKSQTLNKNMVGLDRENMKLVFLDRSNHSQQIQLIDLPKLSSCHLLKKKNPSTGYISNISLQCTFKEKDKEAILLPFYNEANDTLHEMMRLSKKASYWEKSINLFREGKGAMN